MAAPAESISISAEPIRQISPKRRVPGMPDHWQQFFACVIFHMILPFSPILIEFFLMNNPISEKSITLSASMYVLSIGVSSRNILIFCAASVISVAFAVAFGFISAPQILPNQIPSNLNLITLMFMVAISIPYISERYNRHVVSQEPFLIFMSQKKDDENAR